MKRFIFDLDCTLLTGNFKGEIAYFNDVFGKQSNKIIGHVFEFLDEYEHISDVDYLYGDVPVKYLPELLKPGKKPRYIKQSVHDPYCVQQENCLVVPDIRQYHRQTYRKRN